jgi:hypothetical protein
MTPRTVPAAFNALLADLKLTAAQRHLVNGRLRHLGSVFESYETSRPPVVIGSYGRGTVIRRERDIDVMVVLAAKPYEARFRGSSQTDVLYWLRNALKAEYPNTKVSTRKVALCLDLGAGFGVDLIPVFDVAEVAALHLLFRFLGAPSGAKGFYLPNGRGGWHKTNPPFHQNLMSDADTRLNGKLKPLVRLMKLWNLREHGRVRSFHLEMMVERAWHNQKQIPALPLAMAATLEGVARLAGQSFSDPWSDGGRLDDYLDATRRRTVVKSLQDDAQKARKALEFARAGNEAAALERWSVIFGHDFPA